MLCGKPVISTANGGVEDFLTDGNSIKIPIKDPQALMEAILRLRSTYHLYRPAKIRIHIVKNYGRQVFRERMKNLYERVINQEMG
jgi:glycosyltransferase involved in cell wall biosynthesis